MSNIPLIVFLGKNLAEYEQQIADLSTFTTLINQQFPADLLQGHTEACRASLVWV